MSVEDLSYAEFDAMVTGEIIHSILWIEEEINKSILAYFGILLRADEFGEIFFYRDCLTFQNKIDIIRAILKRYGGKPKTVRRFSKLLDEVEEAKALRNALCHGMGTAGNEEEIRLAIRVISRSGKEKIYNITPESHADSMEVLENLLQEIRKLVKILFYK